MGITFYCSHRLEALAATLADHLRPPPSTLTEAALFQPAIIAAPNRNINRWLQLQIARRNDIAIHLQFKFLEEVLWHWLESQAAPEAVLPERLEKPTLHWLVLGALLEQPTTDGQPDLLAPLRAYAGTNTTASGSSPLTRRAAAKAWQLADRLAVLLRDYEYHRPDWVAWWRDPKRPRPLDLPDTPISAAEGALYGKIMAPDGLAERFGRAAGRPLRTLPGLAKWILTPKVSSPAGASRPAADVQPLHLFSFPQISPFHRHLLLRMAADRPVHIYLLNLGGIPIRDLPLQATTPWLPVGSGRKIIVPEVGEVLVHSAKDSGSAEANGNVEAAEAGTDSIAGWGRAGSEGLHLIAQERISPALQAQTAVHWLKDPLPFSGSVARESPTLLEALQARLLGASAAPPLPVTQPGHSDESIVLARCPSVQREVEAVYNCILRDLTAQPDLLQTDILVMAPNMERYRPAIHAVFDRGTAGLGYNLGDVSGAGDSLYAQGVLAALALVEGRFTRAEVFEFLRNPCVQAALGIDSKQLARWSQWADALHVFGEDAPAGASAEASQPPADHGLFGWRRALSRLQLGRVMAAPSPAMDQDEQLPSDWLGLIPFADAHSSDTTDLDAFVHALELLSTAVGSIRAAGSDGERWRRELHALLDRFLAVPEEHPEEQTVQSLVAGLFEQLEATLRTARVAGILRGPSTPASPAALVREALTAGLQEIPSRQGRYLSGGVTISTQFPLRPIPFRRIFMLGLDEISAPARLTRDALDLRREYRLLGDVDEADLQRYMFLEAVLSARERLYLSCVNRDLQDDRAVSPSALLTQLLDYLREQFPARPIAVVDVPLHGHDPSYFLAHPTKPGEPVVEKCGFARNFSPRDRILAGSVLARELSGSPRDVVAAAASGPGWGHLLQKSSSPDGGQDVSFHELARFLENPLRARLLRHLGVSDFDEDDWTAEEADAEPFFLGVRIRRSLERRMIAGYLATRSRAQALTAATAQLELRHKLGETPAGSFHAVARAQLLADLGEKFWSREGESIEALLQQLAGFTYYPLVILGDSPRSAPGAIRLPPLELPPPAKPPAGNAGSPAGPVRLHGALEHLWLSADGADLHLLAAVPQEKPEGGDFPARELFTPVLAIGALLAAAGSPVAAAAATGTAIPALFGFKRAFVHGLFRDRLKSYRCAFDATRARMVMPGLAAEFLNASRFEYLDWRLLKPYVDPLRQWTLQNRPTAAEAADFQASLVRDWEAADEDYAGVGVSALEQVAGVRLPDNPAAIALRRFELLLRLEEADESAAQPVQAAATNKKAKGTGGKRTRRDS